MTTGNKLSFACEFTIHFNVKDKVALDQFKSNENLSLSGLLMIQSLFLLKYTPYIQHIIFNQSPSEVSTCFLVYM